MSGKICLGRHIKFRIALDEVSNGSTVDSACKKAGISRSSYFRYKNMLKDFFSNSEEEQSLEEVFESLEIALAPRSKRPKKLARKIDKQKRDQIIEEAQSGRHRSGWSVVNSLRGKGINISDKIVISVLREEGIYNDLKKGLP